MAVNWYRIASQLPPELAKDALRNGANAERQSLQDQLYAQRLQADAKRIGQAIERRRMEERAAVTRTSSNPLPKIHSAPQPSHADALRIMRSLTPEELKTAWGTMVQAVRVRHARGEISAERAAALEAMVRDFDRARALPDLEDRTTEMNRILRRFGATFGASQTA